MQCEPLLCSLGGAEGFYNAQASLATSGLRENTDLGSERGAPLVCATMEIQGGDGFRAYVKPTPPEETFLFFISQCTDSNCS